MKSILIIEDESPLAKILQDKLISFGFKATISLNGEDALKILKTRTFDLILLDLILPKIDGFSILNRLKESKVKTTIFVLSNLGQTEDQKKAIGLGVIKYFVKSDITLSDIIDYIKKFLEK